MMPNRIVSFLPSATEILYELGVGDDIVGVTHECNYPEQAKTKPRVIHSSFDPDTMTSQEIDDKVVDLMHSGKDIYILDEQTLKKANPNLIISQGICEVCSPYTKEVNRAVTILNNKPEVLILDPRNLDDILTNILEIAKKVGKEKEAQSFIGSLKKRITHVQTTPKNSKPKILCVEWLDPLFTAGHWVPQLVEMAGGINGISSTGDQSRRMEVDETIKFEPDIIILMPCGFDVKRTILEYEKLANNISWKSLAAVQNDKVYAVNANEYFSKPGPRTVTGLEILAKIIHPELFPDLKIPDDSFQKINTKN
ncbi:MAG: cobalamin-binding protein [Thaumarchaeota archaeon]|nr:cobalamin-binding protein [Nitrososphaerota archaeon]MBI3641818.1 cobalamin-binding protein [Nitrososphaerota archaeon]